MMMMVMMVMVVMMMNDLDSKVGELDIGVPPSTTGLSRAHNRWGGVQPTFYRQDEAC